NAEELAAALKEAAAAGQAVIPVGGGRALGMGNPPERFDLALETVGLDRLVEYSPADLTVTVEAGMRLEALQSELARAGQFLPLDPFGGPGHSVGGLLACGWSGPLRLRYGTARDYLVGLRVALPDGRLARSGGRVVKNVSGYDLNKLHLGALGSLGVIVEASFKLFPRPLKEVTVVREAGSHQEAWVEAERALALPLAPVALELVTAGRGYALAARLAGAAGRAAGAEAGGRRLGHAAADGRPDEAAPGRLRPGAHHLARAVPGVSEAIDIRRAAVFQGPDAPADDDLSTCVHCGLC